MTPGPCICASNSSSGPPGPIGPIRNSAMRVVISVGMALYVRCSRKARYLSSNQHQLRNTPYINVHVRCSFEANFAESRTHMHGHDNFACLSVCKHLLFDFHQKLITITSIVIRRFTLIFSRAGNSRSFSLIMCSKGTSVMICLRRSWGIINLTKAICSNVVAGV